MSYRLLRAFLILLLCFGIFLSTRVTALAASADIQLSSSVGAPTSSIVVTGSNFQQGEKVIISFDALRAGSTTTDSTGAFKKDITVPANALPGNQSVDATGQASGLSASATFLVRTNWPMSGYNQARTRYNHLENVINPTNASTLVVDWTAHTGDFMESSPAVDRGLVYVGSLDGNLYAFNTSTGAVVWTASEGDDTTPAVANGLLYINNTSSRTLDALNASTGALVWSSSIGDFTITSPAVSNGIVYIGSDDQNLYAFNAATGTLIWSQPIGISVTSPAIANGIVYMGAANTNLSAFNAATGALVWSQPVGNGATSSPAVANGLVYVCSFDHNLYALDAANGTQLAKLATGNVHYSSPAVANGVVYVGSEDRNLYAFHLPGTTP